MCFFVEYCEFLFNGMLKKFLEVDFYCGVKEMAILISYI